MNRKIVSLAGIALGFGALSAGCVPQSVQPIPAAQVAPVTEDLSPAAVASVMTRVADWQYAQFDPASNQFKSDGSADGHPLGWVPAVMYVGLVAHARSVGGEVYWDKLLRHAERNDWGMAPRLLNADDYAIGQLYLDLAAHYHEPEYARTTRQRLDHILSEDPHTSLEFVKSGYSEKIDGRDWPHVACRDRWCWCDALFMAPPVWMEMSRMTGDDRYAKFADREFRATTDFLYDKQEHLYYRDSRFFPERSETGEKVFWGRGNGWTIGGLARTIEQMPAGIEREWYERIFRESATKLASLQTPQGYWSSSLLSPSIGENPETSGTGLIVYALAWGVNRGLLDRATFEPVIDKGWLALVRAVHADGKLGWVQQVAAAPGAATFEDSQLYGVGAFLMAGEQVLRLRSRPSDHAPAAKL